MIFAGLLFLTIGGFYLFLENSKTAAQNNINEGNAKLAQHQSTQKDVDGFIKDLADAKAIIGSEAHYSTIIPKIAQHIPSGIVLESLTLDTSALDKPISLTALGKNKDDAIRIKTNLEKSEIFSDVHLETVVYSGGNQSSDKPADYPITITISVTPKPEVLKQ
ncbi:hypothetical protein KOY48_04710 [Candidatus Minimicrobia naudis]|uniref:PilN domain-containing protein n=1 Tax=Candidatus Minimicrobia naudis TaxID=2841263 RepID=A0A8F1SBP0_9BACT|nr:hypothetical protein KOY48_04710 [Candidatus Minimicrobia naudis]